MIEHEAFMPSPQALAQPVQDDVVQQPELTLKQRIEMAMTEVNQGLMSLDSLEAVEETAFGIMESLPESQTLFDQIAVARFERRSDDERALVAEQRSIYDNVVGELALIAGIETDTLRVERENTEYRQRLGNLFDDSTVVDGTSDDILLKVGMLVEDPNTGEQRFAFPETVFPPHIKEKWDHYADIVARHSSAEIERQSGGAGAKDPTLITQLNFIRTQAHNNLSLSIKEFLDLPESWDLDKCRKLVIKMRDNMFPTLETAEKHVTADQVRHLLFELKGIVARPVKVQE